MHPYCTAGSTLYMTPVAQHRAQALLEDAALCCNSLPALPSPYAAAAALSYIHDAPLLASRLHFSRSVTLTVTKAQR
jgi:hypothetical protein